MYSCGRYTWSTFHRRIHLEKLLKRSNTRATPLDLTVIKSCTERSVTSLPNPCFLPCKNVNSATRELHKLWRCPLTLSELHKVVHCKQDGQIVSKTWQGTWLQRMSSWSDCVDTEPRYLDIRCMKTGHWCTNMHRHAHICTSHVKICPDSLCLHEICLHADWLGDQAPDHWLSTRPPWCSNWYWGILSSSSKFCHVSGQFLICRVFPLMPQNTHTLDSHTKLQWFRCYD